MTQETIAKLEQLDRENDPKVIERIDNAKTVDDIITLLAEHDIHITEAELRAEFTEGELDLDTLSDVAGGGGLKVGFFHGYKHGMANDEYKNGGGPLYRLGSWCGQTIGGHNW